MNNTDFITKSCLPLVPFSEPFRCCCPLCMPSVGNQKDSRTFEIWVHQWYGPFSISFILASKRYV